MTNNDAYIKAVIIALYNKDREIPIAEADFDFQPPIVYSGPESTKNTLLHLLPKVDTGKFGQISIYYNRINLSQFTGLTTPRGVKTSTFDLCDDLNAHYGIGIYPDDLMPAALSGVSSTVTITASGTSLMFTGSGTLTLE